MVEGKFRLKRLSVGLMPTAPTREPARIVGVGSSAGGLEPVVSLLEVLPKDCALAVVCVSHLDPRHASNLVEILSRSTKMVVSSVVDGAALLAGHVYVMPPNVEVSIVNGRLHLEPRVAARGVPAPIDVFFASLARSVGPRAVGVVLSGSASDGANGVKVIKESGGATFAQDSLSAKFPDMPLNAVRSGFVDEVLPPALIGEALLRLALEPVAAPPSIERPRRSHAPESADAAEKATSRILTLLGQSSGVDFSNYKRPTLMRRIQRRMGVLHVETVGDYADVVASSQPELAALFEDVLIDVTSFFRKPDTFAALQTFILPRILKGRPADSPIRVWVPGCSSGEEAYSIAMALIEILDSKRDAHRIQVFGTDVSEESIQLARRGDYPVSIREQVSEERLNRFFVRTPEGYQVSRSLRDICVFARHNLLRDPPFSRLDIISCRNVMIYLGPVLQDRAVPTFHYSLGTPGFLMLGEAETLTGFPELFEVVDKKLRVFQKKPGAPGIGARAVQRWTEPAKSSHPASTGVVERPTPADPVREADRLVLNRYTPPGVILSDEFDVLQFRGRTGLYLEAPPGQPNINVLRLAREGLVGPLRTALLAAKRDGVPVTTPPIELSTPAGVVPVVVEVVPYKTAGMESRHFLVLFNEQGQKQNRNAAEAKPPPRTRARKLDAERKADIAREELASVKDYLEGILRERDEAIEEMKAESEELQSANEELQSTNEEMETTKEELQSGNEELTTLNDELQDRSSQLAILADDLNNILLRAETAILVIDGQGLIRRITKAASDILGAIPRDIGQSFKQIANRLALSIPSELFDAKDDTPREAECQASNGTWYQITVRRALAADGRFDGHIVTLIDIDERKRAATVAAAARDYAETIVSTMGVPIVVLDDEFRVISANAACEQAFNGLGAQLARRSFDKLAGDGWSTSLTEPALRRLVDATSGSESAEARFKKGDRTRVYVVTARRLPAGAPVNARILVQLEDVTDRRNALAVERSKLLTREMARRLLLTPTSESRTTPVSLRALGRTLLPDPPTPVTPEGFADVFALMGLGSLRFVSGTGDRWEFAGSDLIERRPQSSTPTCYLTLGYLEAAVGKLHDGPALGSEMKCQSTGHDECVFVVKAQSPTDA